MSESKPKKMRLIVRGENPLVITSGRDGLSLLLIVRNKDALDVVKMENGIGIRMIIPNDQIPMLAYLCARRLVALSIAKRVKKEVKTKEVDISELFEKAKEIEVPKEIEEEDIASLMK